MKKEGITHRFLAVVVVLLGLLALATLYSLNEEKEEFYYAPPNKPPIIGEIDSKFFVCEGEFFSHEFEAMDPEGDILESHIYPKYRDPFFIREISRDRNITKLEIYSGKIEKEYANRDFREIIFLSDGQLSDIAITQIEVIEVNNPPQIEPIGVQTADLKRRETGNFYKEVFVNDMEDGDQDSGKLTFNTNFISGEQIFNIDQSGIINFTTKSSLIGNYDVSICVRDSRLEDADPRIASCEKGASGQTVCEDFQLTITNKNLQPTILSFYPEDSSFNTTGDEKLFFNVSKFDPDGTRPDTRWYVDDKLIEYDPGKDSDEFEYIFGCGISGRYNIRAEITDGILKDSFQWDITVEETACPTGMLPGTDVERAFSCQEKWACYDWDLCQGLEPSFEIGVLSDEDYREIKDKCSENSWDDEICGFQIRNCFDISGCNTTREKLPDMQACYFTLAPDCSDDVNNCHDGSCEFLADCGGPCADCATCSDNIQNQEEEGKDCGGPCPDQCSARKEIIEKESTKRILLFIFAISVLLVVLRIVKISKIKKELKEPSQHEERIVKNENKEV